MFDFLLFFSLTSLPTPQKHCPAASSSCKASLSSLSLQLFHGLLLYCKSNPNTLPELNDPTQA